METKSSKRHRRLKDEPQVALRYKALPVAWKTDHGFSLMTESGSYTIEAGQDLSQYANKRVKVTGVLEHHTQAPPSATSGGTAVVTDIRLRMIATVIGGCNHPNDAACQRQQRIS
jgi:hypothetical protein